MATWRVTKVFIGKELFNKVYKRKWRADLAAFLTMFGEGNWTECYIDELNQEPAQPDFGPYRTPKASQ
jgi:hypothetical protein